MTLADSVNWTSVLVALIAASPAIIAAIYAGRIHRKITTPSGTSIGKQVESTYHTAIANNQQLVAAGAGAKKVATDLAHERAGRTPTPPSSPDDTTHTPKDS